MRIIYERCCGLDIHKASITACALITEKGEDSRRDTAFWDNDGGLAGTGRMAPAERNPTRGDGIDGCVVEAGVEYFRACRVRVLLANAQEVRVVVLRK